MITQVQPLPQLDVNGIWHIAYCLGLAFFVPVSTSYLWKSTGSLKPAMLLNYLLFQCVWFLEWPSIHFGPYTHDFQSTTGQVFAELSLITFGVYYLRNNRVQKVFPAFAVFCTICVWFNWTGFMHAPSFNMAMAAACIPLIASPWVFGFIVLTALTHHGSTALVIIAAQLLASMPKLKKKSILGISAFAIGCAAILMTTALIFKTHPTATALERLGKWGEYLAFWREDWKRVVFGVGPGSFVWYSIITHPYQTGLYLQMHNDWLQVLWENGLIGFGLMVGVIRLAIKRVWRTDLVALQGLFGCMAFGLTYNPLRYFPSALLIAYFLSRALIVEGVQFNFARFGRAVKSHH